MQDFVLLMKMSCLSQLNIRQTVSEPHDNYDRALRKFEQAESTLKKFV